MLMGSPAVSRFSQFVCRGQAHLTMQCPQHPEVPADAGSCGCGLIAVSCAAMWALCALCIKNRGFQEALLDDAVTARAVIAHLSCDSDEAKSAAVWLLCNTVMEAPSLAPRLMDLGVAAPLMQALSEGSLDVKGLAAWALRALVVTDQGRQTYFQGLNAVAVLGKVMRDSYNVASIQASAVWALGTLANEVKDVQDQVREEGILETVVALLASPSLQVQNQASLAVYYLAARNSDNQTYVGAHGGIERLVSLLPKATGSIKSVEKVMSSLLCLCLKHPVNQRHLGSVSGYITQIVRFLGCSSPRIQGLTAGLVRSLVAEQPMLQTLLAAHGAFAYLADLCTSKDAFAQEQGVAAMYNMLSLQALNKPFLASLGVEVLLFGILADSTKPTKLAYTCAVMVLHALCEGNEEFTCTVRNNAMVVQALLRFCHPSCGCPRLRGHADRLLYLVAPEVHAAPRVPCCLSTLSAIVPFTPGATDRQLDCLICQEPSQMPMVFLPCFHVYHVECITSWLGTGHDKCCMCSTPVLASLSSMIGRNRA